jgi:hypothetical protein
VLQLTNLDRLIAEIRRCLKHGLTEEQARRVLAELERKNP